MGTILIVAEIQKDKIRDAIKVAINSNRSVISDKKESQRDYIEKIILPVYTDIVESDTWPSNAQFTMFFGLADTNEIMYEGLGLRLYIDTPKEAHPGFALPVVDVWYGKGG